MFFTAALDQCLGSNAVMTRVTYTRRETCRIELSSVGPVQSSTACDLSSRQVLAPARRCLLSPRRMAPGRALWCSLRARTPPLLPALARSAGAPHYVMQNTLPLSRLFFGHSFFCRIQNFLHAQKCPHCSREAGEQLKKKIQGCTSSLRWCGREW